MVALIVGFGWGLAVMGAVIFTNQNYEMVKGFVDTGGNAPLIFFAIAGAVALSLLIFLVMILSGLLQTLAGRRMPTRWMIILGFLFGSAAASFAVGALDVAA